MQLNKPHTLILLVSVELLVEFVADAVESFVSSVQLNYLYTQSLNIYLNDIAICLTIMTVIIACIVFFEPKKIELFFVFICKRIYQIFKSLITKFNKM